MSSHRLTTSSIRLLLLFVITNFPRVFRYIYDTFFTRLLIRFTPFSRCLNDLTYTILAYLTVDILWFTFLVRKHFVNIEKRRKKQGKCGVHYSASLIGFRKVECVSVLFQCQSPDKALSYSDSGAGLHIPECCS